MHPTLRYSTFRSKLRRRVNDSDLLLEAFRLLRHALLQGPWQPWLIRWYETHDRRKPLRVASESMFPDLDAAAAAQLVERDAYAPGFVVPAELVERIATYSRGVGAKRIDDAHLECEAVHRVAHDPTIVEVARRYLRAEPRLLESKLVWTIPQGDAAGRQRAAAERGEFHYDLPDVKALAVFVYITDVDADSGPHVVILGSQERRTPAQIFRRTLSDLAAGRRYPHQIHMVTGPRGTGWFEDIVCYHKQAPGTKPRLMLSLLYALHRRPLAETRHLGKKEPGPLCPRFGRIPDALIQGAA